MGMEERDKSGDSGGGCSGGGGGGRGGDYGGGGGRSFIHFPQLSVGMAGKDPVLHDVYTEYSFVCECCNGSGGGSSAARQCEDRHARRLWHDQSLVLVPPVFAGPGNGGGVMGGPYVSVLKQSPGPGWADGLALGVSAADGATGLFKNATRRWTWTRISLLFRYRPNVSCALLGFMLPRYCQGTVTPAPLLFCI